MTETHSLAWVATGRAFPFPTIRNAFIILLVLMLRQCHTSLTRSLLELLEGSAFACSALGMQRQTTSEAQCGPKAHCIIGTELRHPY